MATTLRSTGTAEQDGSDDIVTINVSQSPRRLEPDGSQPKPGKAKAAARKKSWVHTHTTLLTNNKRRCKHCNVTFAVTTSTGTISKHLAAQHHVHESTKTVAKPLVQLGILDKLPLASSRNIDSAVSTYFVQSILPHDHVGSVGFLQLMATMAPLYKVISPTTIKRRTLEMYIVLKCIVMTYFSQLAVACHATFDGWSNQAYRGFYAVTLHWIDVANMELHECILDFFHVAPGPGAGERCGSHLVALFVMPSPPLQLCVKI
ncbi:hypothetical protein ACHHYP_20590 [Achlya hypogyna]|uniref:BED-type domain-containing protein n=1 Tax=Achlya hypogyna TaxID=1202772 RepID=A0A1V9YHX2_ACHHY|nr:hypothetical protein ACHHYP_20590 [Achlya hypogyna]